MRLIACVLVLLALALPGCRSSGDSATAGRPLSAEELEYQRQLSQVIPAPLDAAGRAKLLVRLNQNLELWHRGNLEMAGSDDQRLVQNIEEVLQRHVYLNFDDVLYMLEAGEPDQKSIAAAALGFSRLKEPQDATARVEFLARWPQVYPRAVEPLVRHLARPEPFLVQNCLLGLWKLGDPNTPVQPVLALIDHEDEEIRAMAALALSTILTPATGETAISALINALYDPMPKVRIHAVTAVGAIRHQNSAGRLAQLLDDPYLLVQANAARSLGRLGNVSNCQYLLARLESLLRDRPTGEYREHTDLDTRRDVVYRNVVDALAQLSGENYGDDIEKWRQWWNENRPH